MTLTDVIAKEFSDPVVARLFCDLFGDIDPRQLGERIARIVPQDFGKVQTGIFASISVGGVFGFETDERQRLVVKVYSRRLSRETLEAVTEVQRTLDKEGFPVPALCGGLVDAGDGLWASIMRYVDGTDEDGHDPVVRRALAEGLAGFSNHIDRLALPPVANSVQAANGSRLWPIPHKSTIRLAETSKGAGFLRDRARRARRVLNDAKEPPRLAHLDWGTKNARFRDKRLVAVFDWDSLGTMGEATMVGKAAATFAANWEIPTKITPSPVEARAFVEEYLTARVRKFSREEWAIAAAAADWQIAVIARQEWGEGVREQANTFVELVRALGDEALIEI